MNREVRYKAKRYDNKQWVEGSLIVLDADSGYYFITEEYLSASTLPVRNLIYDHTYLVDPDTICQLVQTDKVRVWENDIVRWEDEDDIISVIRYDFEEARFVLDDYGISGCLMEYGFDETAGEFKKLDTNGFGDFYEFNFEVIGNIFDNPELIKSEF